MTPASTLNSSDVALPPSFAQELLWLLHGAAPESTAYNVPRTRRLVGALHVDALRGAFDALVERHEILRTTYASHGDRAVQVVRSARLVEFHVFDLRSLGEADRLTEARRIVLERARRPFDLTRDQLLRVALISLGDADHVLHIDSHHIAFDGWSRDILFRELSALYRERTAGRPAALPPLPIQYADYAIWEREHLSGERLEKLLRYWREQLGDAEFVLQLPTDFPRPAVPGTGGITERITIEPALLAGIKALGTAQDATLYMTILAAYATVLHRYTGQSDVLIGSPSAGRSRPETEGLIGYFANTMVQRARFAGDPSFAQLLGALRESVLGAFEHQDIPFEKLVLELQGGQQLSHSPLFQAVLTSLGTEGDGAADMIGDIESRSFGVSDGNTKFDLTLFMSERDGALTLALRARSDLFAATTVRRMLGHLRNVLERAVAEPARGVSQLSLLTVEEQAALAAWNHTAVEAGAPVGVVELFEAQAERVPSRVAVISGPRLLTYAELSAESTRIARALHASGVTPGATVGVLLDRSVELIAAILGVLKAGGAYVPLLPEQPPARTALQLTESGARLVVTSAALADRLPAGIGAMLVDDLALAAPPVLVPAPNPSDLAYVLYTSGSTGVPKGVGVTHANVVHYTRAIARVFADVPRSSAGDGLDLLDGWHFGMVSSLAADLGNTALFPSLLAGGTLHVLERDVATNPERFAAYLATHALDVLKLTPNHLAALLAGLDATSTAQMLPRRWAVLGGEAFGWDLAHRLLDAGRCRILNHYGPTETTVGSSTFEVTAESARRARERGAQTVPVGSPLANMRLHVLDARRNVVPLGVHGELYIAGAGVSRGYLNRAELTAERFVPLDDEDRSYRTGDRVRRLDDGTLEFLGRADNQVKIRGYRVELGEVEQVLAEHPGITQAAAMVRAGDGEPRLVAYVVARAALSDYAASHGERPTPETLKAWAASRLPDYMLPASVVVLERLPLSPNGKVDRAALPEPLETPEHAPPVILPRTPTEEAIASIWMEVLKRDALSVTDDFISLGGHSLLAIRVLGRLSRRFGVRLPLRTLFDAPTVAQLSEIVDLECQLAAVSALTTDAP